MPTQKPYRAVLVSVERDGNNLRVRVDDAECDVTSPKSWSQKEHVTNKLFTEESFREMDISDEEFADFGALVFARLNAFLEMGEA
jgi:hypothetical protein